MSIEGFNSSPKDKKIGETALEKQQEKKDFELNTLLDSVVDTFLPPKNQIEQLKQLYDVLKDVNENKDVIEIKKPESGLERTATGILKYFEFKKVENIILDRLALLTSDLEDHTDIYEKN